MNYLYVKYEHYAKFIECYNTDRLCKNLKIHSPKMKRLISFSKNELIKELYDRELITKYNIESNTITKIWISFFTDNGYKYRLDIFRGMEKDKSENFINHIAFSDFDKDPYDEENYETLLNRNETIEIINRLHYILKDLVNKNIINNHFCIGGAKLLSKNNIYQYALKILVGDDGFDKLDTNAYSTGFGLYFKI